jgi:hypothetical protein
MGDPKTFAILNRAIIACEKCPRLVAYRAQIARDKRRMYRDDA